MTLPQSRPSCADRREADQVGLVPLPLARRRQTLALHIEPQSPQRLGRRAIGYALDPGQHRALDGAEASTRYCFCPVSSDSGP